MTIKIKIEGEGTPEEIAKALRLVAHQVLVLTEEDVLKGLEWEDKIIHTSVREA